MIVVTDTRYYGQLYSVDGHLHFVVKLMCPPKSRPSQYVGPKCKTSDLLCLNDAIFAAIPNLTIDWSEVLNVRRS